MTKVSEPPVMLLMTSSCSPLNCEKPKYFWRAALRSISFEIMLQCINANCTVTSALSVLKYSFNPVVVIAIFVPEMNCG